SVTIAGTVTTGDLMRRCAASKNDTPEGLRRLRDACGELDARVVETVCAVAKHKTTPIIIGGGHNNAYPIIKAVCQARQIKDIPVINLDAHADFRPMEGRHSGNPFRYAHHEGLLKDYHVIGLHEDVNNGPMMEAFSKAGFLAATYDDIFVRDKTDFKRALDRSVARLKRHKVPVGVELDLDAIANMPTSAHAPYGVSLQDAAYFTHHVAQTLDCAYLHIAEGAPRYRSDGVRLIGKAITMLVSAFIKGSDA
ncbi:MAG: arginase family protein, partial [Elusimicrobiota bacterium]